MDGNRLTHMYRIGSDQIGMISYHVISYEIASYDEA
jgi:hypothetical protein